MARRVKCPSCLNGDLEISEVPYKVPYFGMLLLITMRCERCGFTHRDVFSVENREPMRYEVRIKSPEDLKIRVIRSSSGTIRIPELGVRVDPGPFSEGFISNVEGVLERVEAAAIALKHGAENPEEAERCDEFLDALRRARNGLLEFTLILEDPYGNSAILSVDEGKVLRRKLTEEEVKRLKTGRLQLSPSGEA